MYKDNQESGQMHHQLCWRDAEEKVKVKVKVPHDAVLQAWAFQHGAWLINKFHTSSVTGLTAFQWVQGRPYRGRICTFGETVYGHDAKQSLKYRFRLQWRRGLCFGKGNFDHDLAKTWKHIPVKLQKLQHWGPGDPNTIPLVHSNMKRSEVHGV